MTHHLGDIYIRTTAELGLAIREREMGLSARVMIIDVSSDVPEKFGEVLNIAVFWDFFPQDFKGLLEFLVGLFWRYPLR